MSTGASGQQDGLPSAFMFVLLSDGSNDFFDYRRVSGVEENFGDFRVAVFGVHDTVPFTVDFAELLLVRPEKRASNLMFSPVVERLRKEKTKMRTGC